MNQAENILTSSSKSKLGGFTLNIIYFLLTVFRKIKRTMYITLSFSYNVQSHMVVLKCQLCDLLKLDKRQRGL